MGDGGCVSMDVNGRWKDVECDMLLSGAICYIPPPSESIPLCLWIHFINCK